MKNIEIKARCKNPDLAEKTLLRLGAEFRGLDNQTDVYFDVPKGRLKLRTGNVENSLIFYQRDNISGPKKSSFMLYHSSNIVSLLPILTQCLGVLCKVEKSRKIFFIDFVKFHIDHLVGLGDFIEIEVGDLTDTKSEEELQQTCNHYINILKIDQDDFLSDSYSDMILNRL